MGMAQVFGRVVGRIESWGRDWRRERDRYLQRSDDSTAEALLWGENLWSVPTVTGIQINQQSALNVSAVLACVTMLAEDVAKLPWSIYHVSEGEGREEAKGHFLYDLLDQPNEWQNGFEFREQLQVGLILRGNGYAVKIRNGRGQVIKFVPVNPDWVALWEAPDGELFYRVTPSGLHLRAQLLNEPFLIPFADMFHIRGFSTNGLLGASRIALTREAIALASAFEIQHARWMGQGARPSGMIAPKDKTLAEDVAKRLAATIRDHFTGLQNSGKLILAEEAMEFKPFSMTAADLEFIASRQFQLQEIARIFRIPPHMIGELSRSTMNNVAQQGQEYINFTLTGYTNRWRAKFSSDFGLKRQSMSVEFDYRELTTADMQTRVNNWRTMIMSMIAKPDEARIDLNLPPEGGDAAKLHYPVNLSTEGSNVNGEMGQGGGRPPQDGSAEPRLADIDERLGKLEGAIASLKRIGRTLNGHAHA
jgi:HK97 family phage portal protein